VLALAPRRAGGIYIALQACPSRCALAEITAPGAELRLLRENGLPVKAVDTLYVTEKDTLWLGNAWGLHAYRNDEIHSFEYVDDTRSRIHVRAITQSLDGWLWIGTQRGLYRFKEDHEQQFLQNEDWPRDMIFNFAVEPSSGDLWCLTSREIGRLYDRTWQSAFQLPPGQTHRLVTVPREFKSIHPSSKLNLPHGQIWAGGAGGLYQVGLDNYEAAFSYTAEDGLSNAVQALWVDADNVWVGSARGLGRFDGETWKHYAQDALNLRDVRAIAPGHREGQLWIGSWWGGLQKIQQGVHIPGQILTQPVVALSTGLDGSMWAATIDEVYWLPPGSRRWQPLSQSVQEQLGGAIIQTICHQLAHAPGGGTESTLWVGTSNGLLYYRPEREAWGRERALDKLAIQALSVAPRTNRLWIGTSAGLYSELTWRCCYETNTMALAFGLGEEDFLWLGTPQGLEAWILPKDKVGLRDRPVCSFTAANSGLAANRVTALAIRTRNEQQELWIGSPNGISCYQIQQPEEKA
jgi:ligand-binding sensor domain-containing protein